MVSVLCEQLGRLYLDQAVEDGKDHPSDDLVRSAVLQQGCVAKARLASLILTSDVCWRADLLRSVGRLPKALAGNWGYILMAAALKDNDLRLRDAAICALESWGDRRAAKILASHADPIPWLAAYAHSVASELA